MSQPPFARGRFTSESLDPIAEEYVSPPVSPTTQATIDYLNNVSELAQVDSVEESHRYRPQVEILQETLRAIDNQLKKWDKKRAEIVLFLKQAKLAGIHDVDQSYATEALKYLQTLKSYTTRVISTKRKRNESTEVYNTRIIQLAHKYRLLSILKQLDERSGIKYTDINELKTSLSGFFIGLEAGYRIYISSDILEPSSRLLYNAKKRKNRGLVGVMDVIDSEYIIKVPIK
jgi:hypothetical protein